MESLKLSVLTKKLLRMAVNYSKLSAQSALKIKSYSQMVTLLVRKIIWLEVRNLAVVLGVNGLTGNI